MLQTPSPNFNDRKPYEDSGCTDPCMLVMHYTGMRSAQEALDRLCDPVAEVSAHYLVDEDGTVHQLVDPAKRAWHAGVSYWRGIRDVNSASIGIEIVNPGHEFGYRAFPVVQMEAVRDLSLDLIGRYKIAAHDIVGHSDIAPERKQDPGELFDWAWLADNGVGLWPEPQQEDFDAVRQILENETEIAALLMRYGYDPDCDFKFVAQAFMRRFDPQNFTEIHNSLSDNAAAKLSALLRCQMA